MNDARVTGAMFMEMLHQVKVLLTLKGGCSEEQVKGQFKNVQGYVVEAFLIEAIRQGIIREENGAFTLQLKSF